MRNVFGFEEVWSDQGSIYVTGAESCRHNVRCLKDIGAIAEKNDAFASKSTNQRYGTCVPSNQA